MVENSSLHPLSVKIFVFWLQDGHRWAKCWIFLWPVESIQWHWKCLSQAYSALGDTMLSCKQGKGDRRKQYLALHQLKWLEKTDKVLGLLVQKLRQQTSGRRAIVLNLVTFISEVIWERRCFLLLIQKDVPFETEGERGNYHQYNTKGLAGRNWKIIMCTNQLLKQLRQNLVTHVQICDPQRICLIL